MKVIELFWLGDFVSGYFDSAVLTGLFCPGLFWQGVTIMSFIHFHVFIQSLIHSTTDPSIHPSIHLSIYPSIRPSIHSPSFHLSIHHPSIHPFIQSINRPSIHSPSIHSFNQSVVHSFIHSPAVMALKPSKRLGKTAVGIVEHEVLISVQRMINFFQDRQNADVLKAKIESQARLSEPEEVQHLLRVRDVVPGSKRSRDRQVLVEDLLGLRGQGHDLWEGEWWIFHINYLLHCICMCLYLSNNNSNNNNNNNNNNNA